VRKGLDMHRYPFAHGILALLVLASLACGPCSQLSRPPLPKPTRSVIVSTELAEQLESRIRQSLSGEPGQEFILHITDAEASSLLSTQLAKYDESPITDPRVWFAGGKIYGAGRLARVVPVESDFSLVASASVQDGKVQIEIEEASAGTFPLPPRVLALLSQSLNETVDELQWDVQVTALEILEGQAIIRGQTQ
jgi:hypothetical protein